jgi:hypothetical protein
MLDHFRRTHVITSRLFEANYQQAIFFSIGGREGRQVRPSEQQSMAYLYSFGPNAAGRLFPGFAG